MHGPVKTRVHCSEKMIVQVIMCAVLRHIRMDAATEIAQQDPHSNSFPMLNSVCTFHPYYKHKLSPAKLFFTSNGQKVL
jgi:hypothetical protein